jgi:thiosulfate dehydrogenase
MKSSSFILLVLSAGFLAGYICFWSSHIFYPALYHSHAKKEESRMWQPKSIETHLPAGENGARIKFGYLLVTKTTDYIGPLSKDPSSQYAGNNLACTNCHLNAGRKIGAGSFVGVANRFPQFRGRENKIGTLKERVNGCMERSMNGKKMPEDCEEMEAIVAYMEWLSEDVPEDVEKLYKGFAKINVPAYKANPETGKQLYQKLCQHCHMENGAGQKIPGSDFTGYIYPPVGGRDSFNDGAGMNRVITAAEFIKANMPFGATYDQPLVTDEEAFHLAAYINTFERPSKPNKAEDFPDRKLKPVSTPYGPWADEFSPEQHKFGPFPPMFEYYKKQYTINKTR